MVPHSGRRRAERLLSSASINATWDNPPSVEEVVRRDDERLLADPMFSEAIRQEEQDFVQELMARYSAEQVAAALVRLYRGKQSAPEELLDVAPPSESKKKHREDFGESTWFSVSVGRKQNAEPRWLLPMLCTAGNITKREIGAIKMQENETYVQLTANRADQFMDAVGPTGVLEKGIRISRLDGAPDMVDDARGGPFQGKKPFGARKGGGKPWDKKFGKSKPGKAGGKSFKAGKSGEGLAARKKPRKKKD